MPTAASCSVAASSPMSLTGPLGTPAAASASSQCARVRSFMIAWMSGISSPLFRTRCGPVAKRVSVPHSGCPSTAAHRAHNRSFPAARQSGRSAVSNTW